MIDHVLIAHDDDGVAWVVLGLEGDEWHVRERTREPAGYVVAQALQLLTPHARDGAPIADFSFTERTIGEIEADGGLAGGGLALDWQDLPTVAPSAAITAYVVEGKPNDPTAWSCLYRDARGISCDGAKGRLRVQTVLAAAQEWVEVRRFGARAATPPWSELLIRPQWLAREVAPEVFGLERGPHHGLRRRPRPTSLNWRDLLGLMGNYTADEVQRAYRQRAQRHHPDHGGDAAAFRRLVEAKERALEQLGEVAK